MRFSVLGPLQVDEQGETIALQGHRQRAVLALLLLNAGRPVSIDRLASEIWPDQPLESVRDSLYVYVSQLRKALGSDRIVRVPGGYRLDLGAIDEVDSVTFETNAKRAGRLLGSDPDTAAGVLDSSVDLWRGRPYEGFEDLPAVGPEAARLEELRLSSAEDRIEAELSVGRTPAVGDVEKLCEEHPYRERLWGLLARALYRAGRQAEALGIFMRLRTILGDELGLELSPETARLEEQILVQDPVLDPDAAPPPTNLPTAVSSFVGRVDELRLLEKAVHEHRLVTVVGPGGAGKTRLAFETARRVLGSFRDGVWFTDLAQVSDPELVPQAVAAALQIGDRTDIEMAESIGAYLRPRAALLVLDNCEHVVDAVGPLAAALLETAPNVKVLATSRQALQRVGEVRFALEGLATSAVDEPLFEAERLFEARAAAIRRGFTLGSDNRAAVGSICRHLDGMPLAIELAAARVDMLSPAEIDGHLARRFALLADEPSQRLVHRSLRASLDWSYSLLPESARQSFDALGVFEGLFSARAAAAVLGLESELEAISEIRSLVDASLLQIVATVEGDSLYRLLETPRLYARDHLVGEGRWAAVLERHDAHYSDRCQALRPAFFGEERVVAHREIEAELADYHASFDRLLDEGKTEAVLTMGWPLGQVWFFGGRLAEGEARLKALLEASTGIESQSRADALTAASWLSIMIQHFAHSVAWADEAIEIYRSVGDEQGLAYALTRRGHVAFISGDFPAAFEALTESLAVCREIGYDEGTAWPLTLLGQARLFTGEESTEVREMLEEGRRRFIAMGEDYGQVHADMILCALYEEGRDYRLRYAEEMVPLSEKPGADRLVRAAAFISLANSVWDFDEFDRAEGLNRAAARSSLETAATVNSGLSLLQAATFAGHRGQAERAATLFGAGDTHLAMHKAPFMERVYQAGIDPALEILGADRYQELYDLGTQMDIEEATNFLLKH